MTNLGNVSDINLVGHNWNIRAQWKCNQKDFQGGLILGLGKPSAKVCYARIPTPHKQLGCIHSQATQILKGSPNKWKAINEQWSHNTEKGERTFEN